MSNPNENCLKGLRCPNKECGSYGPFLISVTAAAIVDDSGSELEGDTEWEDNSPMSCQACQYDGDVKDFKDPEVKEPDCNEASEWVKCEFVGEHVHQFRTGQVVYIHESDVDKAMTAIIWVAENAETKAGCNCPRADVKVSE